MRRETADIEAAMRTLITLVHNSNSLILALSAWLAIYGVERNDVSHRLSDARTRAVPRAEAAKLDLPAGTPLLRRTGELRVAPDGVPLPIASANAWVVPQRMPAEVVYLIRRAPLGIALQPYGMRRVPLPPRCSTVHDADLGARLVVHLSATLVVGGVPWALTDETIDQAFIEQALRHIEIPPSSVA
jgi:hypothetical protein